MRRMLVTAFIAMAALGSPPGAVSQETEAAEANPAVDAVWMEREILVTYMAFTSFYSCRGLRDKVAWVLEELGARPGFKVTTRGCVEVTGPEVMPAVRIVAALPVAATPEVLAELASGTAKRELAARATGQAPPEAGGTDPFRAVARRVEFVSRPGGPLEDGDCELIEQLRDQVMVPLGATIVENGVRCVPRQVRPGAVRLTVEVLQPVPVQ
ncbi:MAG TPA: hypothetical protein VLH36_03840 [Steroidobacteraceae bacterium]|nr:hypothetical protein [Steroidobacteraceae bacterium]